jgi:hypothetical protein
MLTNFNRSYSFILGRFTCTHQRRKYIHAVLTTFKWIMRRLQLQISEIFDIYIYRSFFFLHYDNKRAIMNDLLINMFKLVRSEVTMSRYHGRLTYRRKYIHAVLTTFKWIMRRLQLQISEIFDIYLLGLYFF